MANKLSKSTTAVRKMTTHYTVSQTADSTLYTAVLNGTVTIPANSFVTLVTSGDVKTTKMTGDSESTWALAEAITLSTATVSTALKAKTEINALAAIATADATDPTTTMALANINKAKINTIIAALKA